MTDISAKIYTLYAFPYQIRNLKRALITHMLPSLPDPSIEAERVKEELWQSFNSRSGTGNEDPADIAERVESSAIDEYIQLAGMRQGAVNMATVMLWHLLEQQAISFMHYKMLSRNELLLAREDPDIHKVLYTFDKFQKKSRSLEIDLNKLSSFSKLSELRLVANTIKHGAGSSANKLYKLRPELFSPTGIPENKSSFFPQPQNVRLPAAGEDIYVSEDDLNIYFDAAGTFWKEYNTAYQSVADEPELRFD